jgi:hypothetical protein
MFIAGAAFQTPTGHKIRTARALPQVTGLLAYHAKIAKRSN